MHSEPCDIGSVGWARPSPGRSAARSPEGRRHSPHLDRRKVVSVAERNHRLPELRRSRDLGEERRIGEYYCLPAEAPALWAEADRLFEVWPGGVRLPGPV